MPEQRDAAPPTSPGRSRGPLPPLLPLAVVVGISPLATDMYIPALPAIAADLGTSTSVVQLSLTAFLVSFAVGQLVVGPVSDALGRRRLLIGGRSPSPSPPWCARWPRTHPPSSGRVSSRASRARWGPSSAARS